MKPPIVVDVTSPRSYKTSKTPKIVQSIRVLLCTLFELHSLGSRREELEWEGTLTDQKPWSWTPSTTRAPQFFVLFPTTMLDERNAIVCSLLHSPAIFLRSSRPCVCQQSQVKFKVDDIVDAIAAIAQISMSANEDVTVAAGWRR
jgi:hypothetical protein